MGYLLPEDESKESQYVYTGGSRGIIRIWDTKTRREVAHTSGIYNEEKETGRILDIMYAVNSLC